MTAYVIRRLLTLIPTWIGITLLAFVLSTLSPGDPAALILNEQLDEPPTAQQLEDFRERTGLNDPLPVQYGNFVLDLVRGDMGTSFRSGEPVRSELAGRFGTTLQIAVPSFLVALILSVLLGVAAALRRNSVVDHGSRAAALAFESVPTFVLAYVLIIVFSVELALLPVAGRGTIWHFVLPVVTLALATTASLMRLTRSSMLDVLGEDYIRTARAMGIRWRTVVFSYALKNAVIPVVTVAALIFTGFVTGTVIVETVFAWPGVGRYVVESIFDRDYAVIQGFVVFTGSAFVIVNLVVDLLYLKLDPRVRLTATTGRAHG